MTTDEIASRLFAAIEAGDADTVRSLYSPDVEIWHNTDELVQGRDDNLSTLGWLAANLPGLEYTDIRRAETADGFVQQHVLRATNRAGEEIGVPACLVVTIADGVITRLDEYLDSAAVTRLLAK